MTKTVYIFDALTYAFLYPYEAQENLDAPGSFITPTYSTDIAPPIAGPKQVACFIQGAWVLMSDYRGETWYDTSTKAPVAITSIGIPPITLTQTVPVLPVTIVTPLQAKRALNKAGLLAQVKSAVAAADIETQLAWESALSFERNSPFILNMGAVLGLTSAQIDALFISAATFT